MTSDLGWLGLVGAVIVADWFTDRHIDTERTLSAATRRTFRTETPAGRYVFLSSMGALSGWYCAHVLRKYGD